MTNANKKFSFKFYNIILCMVILLACKSNPTLPSNKISFISNYEDLIKMIKLGQALIIHLLNFINLNESIVMS